MLLSYRNTKFWEEFRTRHWEPRVPTVIRQPFKKFPLTEDIVLRAMKRIEEGLQKGDRRLDVMVSINNKMTDPAKPLRRVFKNKADSLDELEEVCGQVFRKQNFGVIVTNCHASHPEVWSEVAAFLQDAHECIDYPVPRSFMDLFYGRYESSFTALHKDTQEIFGFVVRGEKRMLAWPFDCLVGKVKDIVPGDRYANKRLDHVDHRKYRKDAVVLDAKAGDIIYWPGDHWHVSEPKSKLFSGMMSLGILRPDVHVESADALRFKKRLLEKGSQDMSGLVSWGDAEQRLCWVTGFGFEIGGAVEEFTWAAKKEVTITKNRSSLILWTTNPFGDQTLVASGGHSLTLPTSKELLSILETICRGETVSISTDKKRAAGGPLILESYFSLKSERKVRKISGRDPIAYLADWLCRVGAVKPKNQ